MPNFAANLTMLFTELPMLKRFQAAANCGFKAVEILFPYEHEASELADKLRDAGLKIILINFLLCCLSVLNSAFFRYVPKKF